MNHSPRDLCSRGIDRIQGIDDDDMRGWLSRIAMASAWERYDWNNLVQGLAGFWEGAVPAGNERETGILKG